MRFAGNIGHKDSLWLKTVRAGAMYQDAHYQAYDFDSIRKQIICGIAVRPEMQVYDLSGKLIRTFGERGRHLTPTDTPVKIYKQDYIDSLKTKSFGEMQRFSADYASTKMWINTSYLQLKYDAVHNRTYRMYMRPITLSVAGVSDKGLKVVKYVMRKE
jgi:predicted ATPase